MSTLTDVVPVVRPRAGANILEWVTTTDHKKIGLLYLFTALGFFILGGLMAELIRVNLAAPGAQVVTTSQFNQLFTIHGTIMLLFFATPIAIGFGNYFIPLQIGAADMAFPRLNALSYWFFLFGGIAVLSGFFVAGGAAQDGWYAYAPLTDTYTQGSGMDLWIIGVGMVGFSGILGAVNFITTIFTKRAPGMTMFRMPIFTWNMLVTSAMILFAFPSLTAALAMLFIDRRLGGHVFDPAQGGDAVLWQHLFWFFGHPEVYIVILPFFGIMSEVVPVFSRRPLFGYKQIVTATFSIAFLSMAVWAHHMFTTGAVVDPFFSAMSYLIAVPTGVKIFNWIATMWKGQIRLTTAMLFAIGMLYTFTIGGITGVMAASPPLDFQFEDSYFIVAHFHNVLIGGTVFITFAGFYYWFPKMTGRYLDERLGKLHFLAWFVGTPLTLLPMYQLGLDGMPRRIANYAPATGWQDLNVVATVGAILLALGTIPFLVAIVAALRQPETAPSDAWGGYALEWATSSPPPEHNFDWLPPIRSDRPVFDARLAAASATSGNGDGAIGPTSGIRGHMARGDGG